MPGPCNSKRRKKFEAQKSAKAAVAQDRSKASKENAPPLVSQSRSVSKPTPSCSPILASWLPCTMDESPTTLPRTPIIHDPGNGPRVRDLLAFIASSFATPPTLSDPLCAEFARAEVLQMLQTVLPEETALALWYNKSRAEARVCPACMRMYRVGQALEDHLKEGVVHESISQQQRREQELSGLCSPMCFILASFNYPSATRLAWGCTALEFDPACHTLLSGPGLGQDDRGLGMLVKMTRFDDLGLEQFCFPAGTECDVKSDFDSDTRHFEVDV